VIDEYLRSSKVAKVQIGCGSNLLEGWLNTDYTAFPSVLYVNAVKPLPFPSGTLDYVFSEHMFEHVSREEGQQFLREVHRALKPQGKVRIATPDLAFLIRLYDNPDADLARRYRQAVAASFPAEFDIAPRAVVVNRFFYSWGHQFIYDFDILVHTLTSAGFTDVRQCKPRESDDPLLRNLESHGKVIGDEFNEFETIVVEARKA
jgi:predicted SAM-dependent methyltransferase